MMSKLILAAGVAALAISVPAAAKPERAGGHAQAQAQQRGGGGQKAQRGGGGQRAAIQRGGGGQRRVMAQSHGGGGQRRAMAQSHGGGRSAQRVEHRGGGQHQAQRIERRGGGQRFATFQSERGRGHAQRIERRGGEQRVLRAENRGRGQQRIELQNRGGRDQRMAFERGQIRDRDVVRARGGERFVVERGRDVVRVRNADRVARGNRFDQDVFRVRDFDGRFRDVDRDVVFARRFGYGPGGCPPGLAAKGCMPPGQAAKLIGAPIATVSRFAALEPLPSPFRSLYFDTPDYYYRYGGSYLYRVDRRDNLIAALIPLFGAAAIGRPLSPYYVNSFYTPPYYSAFYPNSPYDCYRNGYGYVYETDCVTGLVEDVIPTYDYGYGIGQIMPASYGYYNLPVPYRSYFADDDDYYYRYAPGAIYRVDRDTALVSAVVALLTGGLNVGQPLPLGYAAYNVPLSYRTTYYDRPDVWYRYNNGYIYSVNPGTRVVTGIVEYI